MKKPDFSFFSLSCLCIALLTPIVTGNAKESPQSIQAQIEDRGEYYITNTGKRVNFYRKRDIYTDLRTRFRKKSDNKIRRSGFYAGNNEVKNHRFGGMSLIRASKQVAKASMANTSSFQAANEFLAPVYTDASGQAETIVLPEIIVSFNDTSELGKKLKVIKRDLALVTSDTRSPEITQYTFRPQSPNGNFSNIFTATRALMALPYVNWAEPNALVQLKRSAAPHPNDYLYRDQWALNNWGKDSGQLCDINTPVNTPDIDANDAWAYMAAIDLNVVGKKSTPVIAVIDDGVNLNHPDLNIWSKIGTETQIAGAHFCKNDTQGCDLSVYCYHLSSGGTRYYGQIPDPNSAQGICVPENQNPPASHFSKPSPSGNDTHGTQVAGIAGAIRDNSIGIAGVANSVEILPIKLAFDSEGPNSDNISTGSTDCQSIQDALSYAAIYADVIVNSWQILDTSPSYTPCQSVLGAHLDEITDPSLTGYLRSPLGTPVVFAAGNNSAGWRKISISIPASAEAQDIRLAFHKDLFLLAGQDAVWIDNILLPGQLTATDFSNGLPSDASTAEGEYSAHNDDNEVDGTGYEQCGNDGSTTSAGTPIEAASSTEHAYGGTGHSLKLTTSSDSCQYLQIKIDDTPAGNLTFNVWASIEPWRIDGPTLIGDPFRVYINGELTSVNLLNEATEGLPPAFIAHDEIGFPASHQNVITVGASDDGSLLGTEDRYYKSQYGPELNVVAPGINIRSTSGSSYGYFSGTSAAAPMVAGVIANMISVNSNISVADITTYLQNGADQIGPMAGEFAYSSEFNKHYGHGRLNAYKSVHLAHDQTLGTEPEELCVDPNPDADPAKDDFLLLLIPTIMAAVCKTREGTSDPCN